MHEAKPHSEQEVRLHLTMDKRQDTYLRGFVGDTYENGIWKPLASRSFGEENSGMLSWLSDHQLVPEAQYVTYAKTGSIDAMKNHIAIEAMGANRRYVYAPYSAELLSGRRIHRNYDHTYTTTRLIGVRRYAYDTLSENLPSELLHADTYLTTPSTEAEDAYVKAEGVYRSFVYQHYLEIDPSLQDLIDTAFHKEGEEESDEHLGIYEATVKIRDALTTIASYQKAMDPIPQQKDPIRYFLTVSGSGNEALFASASVLAFRSFGIPARYAEGYLVRQANRSAEGSVSEDVTSDAAHAWCEVYMDGIGWVPVDTTPGFYYDTYSLINMLTSQMEIQQTTASEPNDERADSLLNEQKRNQEETSDRLIQTAGHLIYGIFVILLLTLLFLLVLFFVIRFSLLHRYQRRFRLASPDKKPKLMYQRIQQLLRAFGIEAVIGWQAKETGQALHDVLPAFAAEEYPSVNTVLERYYYGQQALRPYEEDLIHRFLEKLNREIAHLSKKDWVHFILLDTLYQLQWIWTSIRSKKRKSS